MDVLERIGLDRLRLVVAPDGNATPAVSALLIAEFAHAGIRFANPSAITDGLAGPHRDLIAHLRPQDDYAPLFQGFPEKLPDFDDGAFRFLIARTRMAGAEDVAWEHALDFTDINWWPASSIPQDQERAQADRRAQSFLPPDSRTEWITVRLVGSAELDERLREWMRDCFTSAASLREDVRNDLGELAGLLGVDGIEPADVRFREPDAPVRAALAPRPRAPAVDRRHAG